MLAAPWWEAGASITPNVGLRVMKTCKTSGRDVVQCRSQWLHGLRRGSAAARLPRLWVRIPPGTWMSVCCNVVCCQEEVSDELITRPEVLPTVVRRCV